MASPPIARGLIHPMERAAGWVPLLLIAVSSGLACAGAADPAATTDEEWDRRIAESRELRLWIATAGAGLLVAGWGLRRAGRAAVLARVRDALLAGLALATLAAWWHPHQGRFSNWHHVADSFHYYVGSKYFAELGYTRLYECTVVADGEAGLASRIARSQIRDLETNLPRGSWQALQDPGRCKQHFSPARWRSFSEDLGWYRSQVSPGYWIALRGDHGYNPPPTWTLAGSLLTNTGPASRLQLVALTWIDPVLLAGMFLGLAWAFGWRVACISLIYWGTNQPASWEWVGGSILRYDWLAASIGALCCLKRERPLAAGLLLAWAVGVRIFPIALAVGPALAALLRLVRTRSFALTRTERCFAAALVTGTAGIVAISYLCFGAASWVTFASNSRLDLATDSLNRVGLGPLLAYRHDARAELVTDGRSWDPYARWRAEREAATASRRPLFVLSVAGYLVLLTLATRRRESWEASVLGIGLVPVLLGLSCYYFGLLLAYACLWQRREDVGAALLVMSSATWWAGISRPTDDLVTAFESFCILVFVAYATWRMVGAAPASGTALTEPSATLPPTAGAGPDAARRTP